MKQYFSRPWMDQYWCVSINGDVLLINYKDPAKGEYKYHYDGDAHIFFKDGKGFDQKGGEKITREAWLKVRDQHISRLQQF